MLADRLCQSCSNLDLPKFIKKEPVGQSGHERIGTFLDIMQRRANCDLCSLFYDAKRLEYPTVIPPPDHEAQNIVCFLAPRPDFSCSLYTEPRIETLYPLAPKDAIEPLSIYDSTLRYVASDRSPSLDISQNCLYRLLPTPSARFDLPQQWRTTCREFHGDRCSDPQWLAAMKPTSLKVIDVNTREVAIAPLDCVYAALSYVWGEDHADCVKSALSDFEQLPKLLPPPDAMPKTIEDAIRATRELQLDYLWVDALCIAQMPEINSNKAHHLAQMDSIFKCAEVVIVAAAATTATSGMFGVGVECRENIIAHIGGEQLALQQPEYDLYIRSTIWCKRAWTFQESMLARRLLVFGKHQAYWLCQCDTWSETSISGWHGLKHNKRAPVSASLPDTSRPPGRVLDLTQLDFFDRVLSNSHARHAYTKLVTEYTSRSLGRPCDGLNAAIGILKLLQKIGGERWRDMYYGLPGSYLDYALLWHPYPIGRRPEELCWKQQLPSWSWAGWLSEQTMAILYDDSLADLGWGEHGIAVLPAIKWFSIDVDGCSRPIKSYPRLEKEWETLDTGEPCGVDRDRLSDQAPWRPDLKIQKAGYFLHFLTTSTFMTIGYKMPRYDVRGFWLSLPCGPYALVDGNGTFAGSIILSEDEGNELIRSSARLEFIFLSYARSAEGPVIGSWTEYEPEPAEPQVEIWDKQALTDYTILNALRIQRNEVGIAERVQMAKIKESAWLASIPKTEWIVLG